MSQFRIKGIDYADDSLQHGLGKGSGRGRPVGSKNGQVMPGAAYMKDYKIVGEKAVGETATPGNTHTGTTTPRLNAIGGANRTTNRGTNTAGASVANRKPTVARNVGVANNNAATPSANVARGKSMIEQLLTQGNQQTQSSPQATQTAAPKASAPAANQNKQQSEIHDSPYSARRINEAGGLESREGRQIMYNNPGLNENYKKQIAKRYGDSDGRYYPKSLDDNASNHEIHDSPWSARRINEAGGLESREGRQIMYNNPGLNEDYKKHIAKVYGDSDGRSYPKSYEPNTAAKTPTSEELQKTFPSEVLNQVKETRANADTVYGDRTPDRIDNDSVYGNQTQDQVSEERTGGGGNENDRPTPNNGGSGTYTAQEETPEQKSFWDNVGGWFSQAGKDIADTAVGAWNTASGAVSDATKWAGDRLGEAGAWAQTAAKDVGDWVGNRGKEFGDWVGNAAQDVGNAIGGAANTAGQWIGNAAQDVGNAVGGAANAAGQWIGDRARDVGNAVGGAANTAGQWIGDRARDVGNAVTGAVDDVGTWWNGTNGEQVLDENGQYVQRGGTTGARENIGNAVNSAGQFIDEAWNGKEREIRRPTGGPFGQVERVTVREGGIRPGIENALNGAGQWIGDRAQDVGNWVGARAQDVNNFVNGVQPGTPQGAPYYDLATGEWVDPSMPSLGQRIGNAATDAWNGVSNAATGAWNGVRDAATGAWNNMTGQGQQENPVARALGTSIFDPALGQNVGDAVDYVRNSPVGTLLGTSPFDPRFGENFNNAVQWTGDRIAGRPENRGWLNENIVAPVANAANSVGEFVRNGVNDIGNGINSTVQNIRNDQTIGAVESRAISAGVNPSDIASLNNMLRSGDITPENYNNQMNGLISMANSMNAGVNTGFGENPMDSYSTNPPSVGEWIGDRARDVGNAVSSAGQWIGDRAQDVGNAVGGAANAAGEWIGDRARDVGNAINGGHMHKIDWDRAQYKPSALDYALGLSDDVYVPGWGEQLDEARGKVPAYVDRYYNGNLSPEEKKAYAPQVNAYLERNYPEKINTQNPFEYFNIKNGPMPDFLKDRK